MQNTAKIVDQGVAALIKDLKGSGLWEDTLILRGAEFGRTPMAQGSGRDHRTKGFNCWFAGGIKGGMSYGNTDDFGYNAVENVVHGVNDLHATILHLMGVDHENSPTAFKAATSG